MRQLIIILGILILLSQSALAEITITGFKELYNLGDMLSISTSIQSSNEEAGIYRVNLVCDEKILSFYVTPLALKPNQRKAVNIPDMKLVEPYYGNCFIEAKLEDGLVIVDIKSTEKFTISNEIEIKADINKKEIFPGDKITISGNLRKKTGEATDAKNVQILFLNNSYLAKVSWNKFDYTIYIPENVYSGQLDIKLFAEDSSGNMGETTIAISVNAVPTRLENNLNAYRFEPKEFISINVLLYDQADELIDKIVEVKILDPDKKEIFLENTDTISDVTYQFDDYAKPGKYTIISSFGKLRQETIIEVIEIENLEMGVVDEKLVIKNIGNINYNKRLETTLEAEDQVYTIKKRIRLKPGETTEIDLSKEVPEGIYDIRLPNGNKVEDITIHDNRPGYKKLAEGISAITGNVVGSEGVISKHPFLASVILIIIIAGFVIFYGRDPIKKKLSGLKDKLPFRKKQF